MITDLTLGENIFNSPDLSIKMKILHAVNKSLDQITVAEICRNAGISRQTFYRHFESKYDIPWWYSIFCRQFYLNEIGRTIDWKTGYYHHLRLIAQERDFFRESIQYSINTPFGQTIMPENRKAVLLDTLENYRHVEVNDNLRFIVEVFSKLECEVMNDWFRSDEPTNLARWTDDLVSLGARPPLPRPGDTRNRSVESRKPFIPSRNEPAEANQQVRFGELVVPWEREHQGARGRTL